MSDAAPSTTSKSQDEIFEGLLREIVGGRYAPQARLPAERALAAQLGASRAMLREALGRLEAWGVIEVRRGSGIVVRDRRCWSLEVLPAYLRYGMSWEGLPRLLGDMLSLRRTMLVSLVGLIGERAQGRDLSEARALLAKAARAQEAREFVEGDFAFMRVVLELGGALPAVWFLNALAGIYLELALVIPGASVVSPRYEEVWGACLSDLEAGDGRGAAARLDGYLARLDERMLEGIG
jgi:DNA-binding FadR family transcriptional regulator